MSAIQLICFIAVAFTTVLLTQSQNAKPWPPRCHPGLIVDCALSYEELVWSKDENNVCKVFLNACIFNNVNCARFRQGRTLLKKITKEECQPLCAHDCSEAPKQRMCTERDGKFCQFESPCEWEKYICQSGKFWFESLGCDESTETCKA